MALDQFAVDRHLVAGPHAQPVADRDRFERHHRVAMIGDADGGLRREIEQRADRAGGLLTRAQLQHLTEQHQHGDNGRSLEIDRDRAVVAAKHRRKHTGRKRRDDAEGPGHAGAERDQREHVEVAARDRLRAAHEEGPAGPQHDRRGKDELHPVGLRRRKQMPAEQVPAHFQRHDRHCQQQPDPEPAGHVDKLGIGTGVRGRHFRFERHAADRTRAGALLPHLRMHRAGENRAGGHRSGGLPRRRAEILSRIGGEFRPAAGRAEEVGFTAMDVAMRRLGRIDRHAADGVLGFSAGCREGWHARVHPYHLVTNEKNAPALAPGPFNKL